MSGIGDYIHYHTENYLDYGTAHRGQPPIPLESVMIAQKQKIQNAIKNSQSVMGQGGAQAVQDLVDKIKFIFRPPDDRILGELGLAYNEYAMVWNDVLMPYFNAEWVNAEQRISQSLGNVFSDLPPLGITTIKPGKQITATTIMSRVKKIGDALARGYRIVDGEKIDFSETEMQQLSKFYDELMLLMEQLDEDTLNQLNNVYSGNKIVAGVKKLQWYGDRKLTPSAQLQAIVDKLNLAVAVSKGTANLQRGQLFEDVILAAFYMGKGLSEQAIKKAVEMGISGAGTNAVVGGQGTSVEYAAKDFGEEFDLSQIIPKNGYELNDTVYKSILKSQNKVDVQLRLVPGKDPIKISAKNINLTGKSARPISLLSSAPLLAMMANMGSHNFVNHYLNQHTRMVNKSFYTQVGIYGESSRLMMLTVFEQAFRGYKQNADKADVFLINDNLRGEVRAFSIGDILSKFLNNFESYQQYLLMEPDLMSLFFFAPWHPESYVGRINKLLSEVAKVKVSVHLLPQLFTTVGLL